MRACVPPSFSQLAGSCRKKLLEYLHSLKQPDGSFLMHVGGEVDVRWASAAGCGGENGWVPRRGSRCHGPERPSPPGAPTVPPPWPR